MRREQLSVADNSYASIIASWAFFICRCAAQSNSSDNLSGGGSRVLSTFGRGWHTSNRDKLSAVLISAPEERAPHLSKPHLTSKSESERSENLLEQSWRLEKPQQSLRGGRSCAGRVGQVCFFSEFQHLPEFRRSGDSSTALSSIRCLQVSAPCSTLPFQNIDSGIPRQLRKQLQTTGCDSTVCRWHRHCHHFYFKIFKVNWFPGEKKNIYLSGDFTAALRQKSRDCLFLCRAKTPKL